MRKGLVFLVLFMYWQTGVAQNDFILLKKDHFTIKTMFTGSDVSFTTPVRYYSGHINSIQKDSINLLEYDIRQIPTSMGVYIIDTVATYRSRIYYKDILKIGTKQKGFNVAASGGSLMGGGILITTIGLGTWIFTKPGDQYHASPKLVIGAAVLGAAGYALSKASSGSYTIGKKYHLEYIGTK